jgi:hypothetical protein
VHSRGMPAAHCDAQCVKQGGVGEQGSAARLGAAGKGVQRVFNEGKWMFAVTVHSFVRYNHLCQCSMY